MIAALYRRAIKPKTRRAIVLYLVPIAIAAVCAVDAMFAVDNLAVLTNGDQFFNDWEVASLTPAEPQDPDIVVVAITEDTVSQFPYRTPVDRQFVAELLNTIASRRPRAIGLDLLFDQPTEPAKDEILRSTLATIGVPLVVSYTASSNVVSERQAAFLNGYVPPRLRGLATLAADQFDVVRGIYPGETAADGTYVPSFSRALAAALGVATPDEMVPIAWHGQPARDVPAFKQYPAQLAKVLPPEWFEDKIVLIGTDLTLADRHRTPFMTVFSGGEGILPGVTIQANSLAQLLHGRKSPMVNWWLNLMIALGCGGVGAGLGLMNRPVLLRVGAGLAFAIALWSGGAALFHYSGAMIGLVAPTLSLGVAFWAMEALSGREARRQREFIRGAFSRYVSPKVVDRLINDPEKMSLQGERREMTYLFTDVANFTTLAEVLDSKEFSRLVNSYLDGVSTIVQQHDGMVDKFIGDAVFAIFNAPIDQPDHASRAVRCALDIDRFAESFRVIQSAANIEFGVTRIGVHTGTAIIGNFGSQSRFDYTAQGDAVNTASRLEGVNKHFGTRICVSGSTRDDCLVQSRAIDFRRIASVVLKGKTTALELWEPLHAGDRQKEFLARYCEAFDKIKSCPQEAMELFHTLHTESPNDPCVKFHLERLRRGLRSIDMVMSEK